LGVVCASIFLEVVLCVFELEAHEGAQIFFFFNQHYLAFKLAWFSLLLWLMVTC